MYEECFWDYRKGSFCSVEDIEQFDDVLELVFATKGSFLDVAVSDKTSHTTVLPDATVIATTSMQGWRSGNEDAHCVVPQVGAHAGVAMTAILDGHGGGRVAAYVGKKLPSHLTHHLGGPVDLTAQALTSPSALQHIETCVVETFLRADDDVEANINAEQCGSEGCTANMLLLTPALYVVGNAGDSRIIVVREGCCAERLSHDHKPDSPREQERIEQAGGRVTEGRVEGLLAVSRALGDFDFKQAGSVSPDRQAVTPFPDVTVHERHSTDLFLVQACDGIWDCMTDDEVASFVKNALADGATPLQAAERLCDACLAEDLTESGLGTDNMSVHLIVLPEP